ncbi:BA14K family protein [Consotaella salsifontis]|uniref:Lectin-like protein BA14k n=1 Tax=Consotaella salsifontis TaxID=1365950 RepID=A0A1T4PTZ1_9HYPH|nr:BA14K family protein [Consotaella salsifontis]SJZ94909.1 BA14K-like protein [Consotaella salsifontis]
MFRISAAVMATAAALSLSLVLAGAVTAHAEGFSSRSSASVHHGRTVERHPLPRFARRGGTAISDLPAYRDLPHAEIAFRPHGSFVSIHRRPPSANPFESPIVIIEDRNPAEAGIAYRGVDEGDWTPASLGALPLEAPSARPRATLGPKIIDVETARLDRKPIGPSGIDVIEAGGARIIRIAPEYKHDARVASITATPSEARQPPVPAPVVRNTPLPRPYTPPRQAKAPSATIATEKPAAAETARKEETWIEPWSNAWREQCAKAYPSFDPDLGTYRAGDGRRRFCTGV